MRELVEEGYLGRLLTFNMKIVQSSAMVPREQHHWWIYNQGEGGDALTIPCGHAVDFMQWCLGDIAEVAGASSTQDEEGSIAESGERFCLHYLGFPPGHRLATGSIWHRGKSSGLSRRRIAGYSGPA